MSVVLLLECLLSRVQIEVLLLEAEDESLLILCLSTAFLGP